MRNSTKILCVVLSVMMVVSLAACSLTPQTSYKSEDTELPIGVYIYNLYSAYNQAQGFAQKSDLYDSEAGTYDGNKSFLKMEITDDDDVTATADEWIKDKADEQTRQILAIYHEFNELGCTIDEATEEGYRNQAKEYWDYGPYYQYYGEQYLNPYSEIFEPIGVSYDSFYIASFYTSAMQSEVFKALYEASGTEAVSDEDLATFFNDNYYSFKYFSVKLYKTEEQPTTDEEGNETTESVDTALSEEEVQAYNDELAGYQQTIAAGGSYDDVIAAYMAAHDDVESDPTLSEIATLEGTSVGDELKDALSKLGDNEATYLTVGEDDNTKVMYFLYKEPITNQTESYLADETQSDTVLHEMKDEELQDLLDQVAEDLDITVSPACNGYQPKMFEETKKKS